MNRAYVFAAVMFESCALRPTCLSPDWVSVFLVKHSEQLHMGVLEIYSLLPLGPASWLTLAFAE